MLERIYLLFEIVAALLVLWALHGSKKRPGISTIIYVCIELIIVSLIEEGWISSGYLSLAYIGIVVIDIFEFNDNLKNAIIYTLADAFFMIGCQFFCGAIYSIIFRTENISDFAILALHFIIVIGCLFLYKFNIQKHISLFLNKSMSNIVVILLGIILLIFILKKIYTLKIEWELLIFILLFFSIIIMVLFKLERENAKKKQYIEQLHQYEQYNIVYKDLIAEIRHRQHDFDNHLQAMYGITMSYNDIDELRKEYSCYYEKLCSEQHIYHLLKENVPSVLTAFLYIKFRAIEEKGIFIDYNLNIGALEMKFIFPDIVELIGNLLDNAVDAVLENDNKIIFFTLNEIDTCLHCKITNPYDWEKDEQVKKFMQDGYSSKGKGHGYGLTNVNRIIDKYHGNIQIGFCTERSVKNIFFDVLLPFHEEIS